MRVCVKVSFNVADDDTSAGCWGESGWLYWVYDVIMSEHSASWAQDDKSSSHAGEQTIRKNSIMVMTIPSSLICSVFASVIQTKTNKQTTSITSLYRRTTTNCTCDKRLGWICLDMITTYCTWQHKKLNTLLYTVFLHKHTCATAYFYIMTYNDIQPPLLAKHYNKNTHKVSRSFLDLEPVPLIFKETCVYEYYGNCALSQL